MMSGSPAWKPKAPLTELARSIIAASLPISHAPKPSPRSQLRSIVFMAALRLWSSCGLRLRRDLPRPGIDGADRMARHIGIAERFDVERDSVRGAQAIGQGAHQLYEFLRLVLRLGHADGLEAERGAGRGLREAPVIGRDHGGDLRVAPGGAAVHHQRDRRAVAEHLDAAIDAAVGDDVVAVQVLDRHNIVSDGT